MNRSAVQPDGVMRARASQTPFQSGFVVSKSITCASAMAPFGFTENRNPVRWSRSGSSRSVNASSDSKSLSRRSAVWRIAEGRASYAHRPTHKPSDVASRRTTVRSVAGRPSAGSFWMKSVMESAVSQAGSSGTPSSRNLAVAWMACASGACCAWAGEAPGTSANRMKTQGRLMDNERALRQEAHESLPGDEQRFRDVLEPEDEHQRHNADQHGRHIDQRAPPEDKDGAGDRAGGRRGHTVHECLDGGTRGDASVVGGGEHDDQVHGREHAESGNRGAHRTRHEIPDERHRDDDRAGRDHGDGHGIEELPLGEPAILLHHAPVQKRHDGEPAPEDEQPRGGEVPEDLPEHAYGCHPTEPRDEPRRPRRDEERLER